MSSESEISGADIVRKSPLRFSFENYSDEVDAGVADLRIFTGKIGKTPIRSGKFCREIQDHGQELEETTERVSKFTSLAITRLNILLKSSNNFHRGTPPLRSWCDFNFFLPGIKIRQAKPDI